MRFEERPILNFYNLAGKSAIVDWVVKDGDKIFLSDGIYMEVIGTPGHSADEASYRVGSIDGYISIPISWKNSCPALESTLSFRIRNTLVTYIPSSAIGRTIIPDVFCSSPSAYGISAIA